MKPMLGTSDQGDVTLPDDAVTQGFAILARRRSGKSTLAGVIEETFCERGDPWVCLDPVSAHWGIRYRDENGQPGKPSGYDVMIVGGKYGDVALDERHGAALAQILVDTNISCVVDLGAESMNAQQKFVADFASELLRINETPRHVLLEEAHTFVPQQLTWDNQKLVLGALTKMITMGGGKGIGYSLITQRSASVSKAVLEQIDNLFVLRMSGPRDLKAVQDWFEHNIGDNAEMKRVLGTLRAFTPGEAWWLSDTSLQRLKVRQRTTYHAGRTPKRGETMRAPKRIELRDVIGKYRSAAEKRSIAVQQERDIKAENVELKKQLAKKAPAVVEQKPCDHVEDMAIMAQTIDRQRELVNRMRIAVAQGVAELRSAFPLFDAIVEETMHLDVTPPKRVPPNVPVQREAISAPRMSKPVSTNGHTPTSGADERLQRVIDAIAAFRSMGVQRVPRIMVAVRSKISPRSSNFDRAIRDGRDLGFLSVWPDELALTDDGITQASADVALPPSLGDLHRDLMALFDPSAAAMLRVIIDNPEGVEPDDLAAESGVSRTSSNFDKHRRHFKAMGLIEYDSLASACRPSSLLFPEGVPA